MAEVYPGNLNPAPIHPALICIDDSCTACGGCIYTCPTKALLPFPRKPYLEVYLCTGCLECMEICPPGAIRDLSTAESLPQRTAS